VHILKSFKDANAAFAAFDIAGIGRVSLKEFEEGARRIRFKGNPQEVFNLLSEMGSGVIIKSDLAKLRQLPTASPSTQIGLGTQGTFSTANGFSLTNVSLGMSKKDATLARKLRADIQDPPPHRCGLTLAASDIRRPLGESMRTASSFYSIPRSATGRMDEVLHPNQVPGEDAEQFSAEHGPGYGERGPESFPYMGMTDHPCRGDKWKFGATTNREQRFGATVPSRQAAHDRELSGMSFLTHEGRRPDFGSKICNTGGISWSKSPMRPGVTHHGVFR
jgi:hypothetical protein